MYKYGMKKIAALIIFVLLITIGYTQPLPDSLTNKIQRFILLNKAGGSVMQTS